MRKHSLVAIREFQCCEGVVAVTCRPCTYSSFFLICIRFCTQSAPPPFSCTMICRLNNRCSTGQKLFVFYLRHCSLEQPWQITGKNKNCLRFAGLCKTPQFEAGKFESLTHPYSREQMLVCLSPMAVTSRDVSRQSCCNYRGAFESSQEAQ